MTTTQYRRIDVHHHVFPPAYVKVVNGTPSWSPEQSIELMDANKIARAMMSVSTDVEVENDIDATVKLARTCNEYTAAMVQDHEDRFGMFAALPMCDMDAAIREVDYAFDTLSADGVGLVTNYGDKHLGDPFFDPLLAHLNRRKAAVFVHPTTCSCTPGHPDMPAPMLEFPFDTTRTIISLLLARAYTKYKDIKFIFCHGGGTIAFLAYRVDRMLRGQAAMAEYSDIDIRAALRGMYFDLTTAVSPPMFQAILDIAPIEKLLFGTDFPFVSGWRVEAFMEDFEALLLTGDDVEKIEFRNARALFPRLAP